MSDDLRARMRALSENFKKEAATPPATTPGAVSKDQSVKTPQKRQKRERVIDVATLAVIRNAEKLLNDLMLQAEKVAEDRRPELYSAGWDIIYSLLRGEVDVMGNPIEPAKPQVKAAAKFLVDQTILLLKRSAKRERAGVFVPRQVASHLKELAAITGIVKLFDESETQRLREAAREWRPIRDRHRAHSAKGETEKGCPICAGEFGPPQINSFKVGFGQNQVETLNFSVNLGKSDVRDAATLPDAYALRDAVRDYWSQVDEKRDAWREWSLRHGFLVRVKDGDKDRFVEPEGLPTILDLVAGRVEPEHRVRIRIPKAQPLKRPAPQGKEFFNWGEAVALVMRVEGTVVTFRLLLPEGEDAELLGNLHRHPVLGEWAGKVLSFVADPDSTRKAFFGLQTKDRQQADRAREVLVHALRLAESAAAAAEVQPAESASVVASGQTSKVKPGKPGKGR